MSLFARLTPPILISLALHAGLAMALALYLDHTSAPDQLAQLDLTSVDLSFAETVDESVPAVATLPVDAKSVRVTPAAALPPPTLPVDAKSVRVTPAAALLPNVTEPTFSPPEVVSAPRQAHVDAPPKPTRGIRPDYPRESRLRGEHGDVALELDVAPDGTVSAVRVLRSPGYPLLDDAAVKAVRAARFVPAMSGGQPVASTVRLTLNFRLK